MGRSLYINQTNKPEILRDGPSIWVKEKGKAGRRIPARFVSRVIIFGKVRLDSDAITLFAEWNTPVTFVNNKYGETAVVIPYNHKLPIHYKEQRILLESEDNISRYERWANAKRAVIQLNLIRRFVPSLASKLEKRGFGEGNYQEILKRLRKVSEDKWLVVNGIVTDIFRNMIIENIIKTGLDPHLGVIHRRHNFGLALDICYILGGESDIQTLQFFRSSKIEELIIRNKEGWIVTDKGIKNIVHRFENKRNYLKSLLDNIIDELFILIREMSS
jgi:CRISPR/Cas system-associated endonuclease Cas1